MANPTPEKETWDRITELKMTEWKSMVPYSSSSLSSIAAMKNFLADGRLGTRMLWTTSHSDHAVTSGVWRFASPRLCLGIVASLLSVSIGSQHIVWLVYTVRWEQWISSSIGSIRPDSGRLTTCTLFPFPSLHPLAHPPTTPIPYEGSWKFSGYHSDGTTVILY